jgi:periplasmic protein TonB
VTVSGLGVHEVSVAAIAALLAGCYVPASRAPSNTGSEPASPSVASAPRSSRGWNCGFPKEAQDAGITSGKAVLLVLVAADGSPERVQILDDPGSGFGAMAARCALAKSFRPAKDEHGNPIRGWTPRITVRFLR